MSETALEQHEQSNVAGPGQTPLDAILGGDGSSTSPPGSESAVSPSDERDDDSELVPLGALRRVRERQKRDAARVRELEQELEKYNEERWFGSTIDEMPDGSSEADPQKDAFAAEYGKGFSAFVAKHGQARVSEVDAALRRLTPDQQNHVFHLVSQGADGAVDRVHEYVQELGLVGKAFKPTSIQDALAPKAGAQPNPDVDQRMAEIDARSHALAAAERKALQAASHGTFIAAHGRDTFLELDHVVGQLIQSNSPIVPHLQQAFQSSEDPTAAVAHLLVQSGVWTPTAARQAPVISAHAAMPSNFVAARSVTSRGGPAFAGPTPLNDIFKR